MALLLVAV